MFLRTARTTRPTFTTLFRQLYTANNVSAVSAGVSSASSAFSTAPLQPQQQHTTTPRRRWARHVIGKEQELPQQPPQQDLAPKEAEQTTPTSQKKRKRRALKPLKAPITLTPTAMDHLRALSEGPEPKLIRISVRNRGCSGLSYQLEYVDKPEKFDEIVEQGDVKVVIDSKALFSVIGSEMDWVDTKLASKFVFKNPNSKGTCGCGESFMV